MILSISGFIVRVIFITGKTNVVRMNAHGFKIMADGPNNCFKKNIPFFTFAIDF